MFCCQAVRITLNKIIFEITILTYCIHLFIFPYISVVVDSLFLGVFFAPIVCGGFAFGPCFVIQFIDGQERAGFFAFTVFLMSCDSQCCVAFPRNASGWTAVCDCGIS